MSADDMKEAADNTREQISQEMCSHLNQEVLSPYGWHSCKDGGGHMWYCSEKQWSRQFPLFGIMSDNLLEKLHKLLEAARDQTQQPAE